mmetsp:Transcript_132626/g.383429  ORF Transcript_132626/g.383429 Transcript_132626/m.383429 type:complete len:216 (+) Transcript_132626:39-686(+)|eukprot:CAMPEP_0176014764 /NCGR_PEP_ID=MMETSP0120_2-20121206/6990_1 /TAXON_ID=160619 /ORGANISM="Kryptoperidinium foliaceum, Strain CCMP 1326" /LENGTH=215 /DNA_ID=CAMNT_0017347713 /DNA_START=38 /DNA_END=682 /DNA_ORIENTATION=+
MAEGDVVFHARGERISVPRSVVGRVPFLEALIADRVNTVKNADGEPVVDRSPVLVRAVLMFVSSGNNMDLFTKLPKDSSAEAMLAELDFFCLDPPAVRPIGDAAFTDDLKDVFDYSGNRKIARNAAAELAVGLQTGAYDLSDHQVHQRLYDCVLHVVSHWMIFGPRLRHHVWQLARCKVHFSKNQARKLGRWVNRLDESDDESDGTVSSLSGWSD